MTPSLQRTTESIQSGIAAGLHIGAQLYVSRRNEILADLAFGESRAGVPMQTDTLMLWLSAGKPVTAVAIAQLWERGKLALDDPVSKFIPEFAGKGKDAITIRHLLTHTAGLRAVIVDWNNAPWQIILDALCNARIEPGWTPGQKAGYHALSTWFLLGEIVQRLSGRPFDRYVREEIFEPIGMIDTWIGLPIEQYRAYGDRIGLMQKIEAGQARPAYPADTEAGAATPRPPSNARGPARELGFFYEMLLNHGTRIGNRILNPQTVEAITARHRVGMMDHTFKHVIDWGLGFILNSASHVTDGAPYGYGPHASVRTFGHGGSQTSTGFCDRENELVVSAIFNGAPGEVPHDARLRALTKAIYEDLGVVSTA